MYPHTAMKVAGMKRVVMTAITFIEELSRCDALATRWDALASRRESLAMSVFNELLCCVSSLLRFVCSMKS